MTERKNFPGKFQTGITVRADRWYSERLIEFVAMGAPGPRGGAPTHVQVLMAPEQVASLRTELLALLTEDVEDYTHRPHHERSIMNEHEGGEEGREGLSRGERETLESYLVALWQCETERGYAEFAGRVLAHVAQVKAAGALIAADDMADRLAEAEFHVEQLTASRDHAERQSESAEAARDTALREKADLEARHQPVDVYEMPDESAESLAARIENGTAVLAFRVCAECAPDEVIERIEDGELDLSDGDALAAQHPCATIRAALANPSAAQREAEVGARALREAADTWDNNEGPGISTAPWLRHRADALTTDEAEGEES